MYLSEPLARYPIRHVTRPADNKSDPNIETATYGLFSTCEQQMRAKVVREGLPYLFFVTTHANRSRALTGYYDLAWYAESTGGDASGDYALAAFKIKFVDPIPLDTLPMSVRGVCMQPFRTIKPIDSSTVATLHELIDSCPDRTGYYLFELRRIEQFSRYNSGGYSYPSWGQVGSFNWRIAARYLGSAEAAKPSPAVRATGHWYCRSCKRPIASKARLKSCPACKEMGTLNPVGE